MKEACYRYDSRGLYQTEDDTSFAGHSSIKMVIEPHEFSMKMGGEVLRSTAFGGGTVIVSDEGEADFYDDENTLLARAEKGDSRYEKVRLAWEQGVLSVQFGRIVTVDHYPNCDGEHDRWSEKWETQRTVTLHIADRTLDVT